MRNDDCDYNNIRRLAFSDKRQQLLMSAQSFYSKIWTEQHERGSALARIVFFRLPVSPMLQRERPR